MNHSLIKLDLTGVQCPDFGLSIRAFFRNAKPGIKVLVQSTIHNAERDVAALCEFGGHTLVAKREIGDVKEFIVERGV